MRRVFQLGLDLDALIRERVSEADEKLLALREDLDSSLVCVFHLTQDSIKEVEEVHDIARCPLQYHDVSSLGW